MTTKYTNNWKTFVFINLCFALLLLMVVSCKETTSTRWFSEKEYYYDDQLSALSLDKKGYWIGGETGIVWHIDGKNKQRYYTGLDRIYDIERDPVDTNNIWIATRNAGLQLWSIAGDTIVYRSTFQIPVKGNRYSPYDIEIANNKLFIATSQGLYSMPITGSKTIQKLSAVYTKEKKQQGEPFLVNSLCHDKNKWLFAATQSGVICMNLFNHQTTLRHNTEYMRQVAVYNQKLYLLLNNTLIIENLNGTNSQCFELPQPVLSFYKVGPTHYFITSSSLLRTDDLSHFVSVPLRRNIPDKPHKIAIPDDGKGFSVLLTANAVWHIPHHLGVINANTPIVASCSTDKYFVYVNNQHELFKQRIGENVAKKIYDFEDDDLPREMYMVDNDLYYYNANNEVCQLTVGNSYIVNQLTARPKTLIQPSTCITSMEILPKQGQILLGVQDYLLRINMNTAKADTVKTMNNKYITAFHVTKNNDKIYIATLNDGVFMGNHEQMKQVSGTKHKVFISDVLTVGKKLSHLVLLTNHQLQLRGGDSIRVDGCRKMFCINDSVLYTIPEEGIHKYVITGGKLKDCGTLFADIHFNAQAGFVYNNCLYIGSDLGVLQINPKNESIAQWITLDNSVPSLQLIGILLFAFVGIVGIFVVSYKRRRLLAYNQLQLGKDDLYRRLSILNALRNKLTEEERHMIADLKQEIDAVCIGEQSLQTTNERFSSLSVRIARLNRDMALQMVKHLNNQIQQIKLFDVFEQQAMVKTSEEARNSNDIELIVEQSKQNDVWINYVQELKERLEKFKKATQGTLVIKGLNDKMACCVCRIIDECKLKPIAEIYPDFISVKTQYERIFAEEGLLMIKHHVDNVLNELQQAQDYEEMKTALINELLFIKKTIENRDRIVLLRALQIIDHRMAQIKWLKTLRQLMQNYIQAHDEVVKENEERIKKKFDTKLFADIESATRHITQEMAQVSDSFFNAFVATDKAICEDIFHFTTVNSQQVRVLILLLAMPRVKRTLLPGMLSMFGNLNPVISRIYHHKINDNREALTSYCEQVPSSIVNYILKLSE